MAEYGLKGSVGAVETETGSGRKRRRLLEWGSQWRCSCWEPCEERDGQGRHSAQEEGEQGRAGCVGVSTSALESPNRTKRDGYSGKDEVGGGGRLWGRAGLTSSTLLLQTLSRWT